MAEICSGKINRWEEGEKYIGYSYLGYIYQSSFYRHLYTRELGLIMRRIAQDGTPFGFVKCTGIIVPFNWVTRIIMLSSMFLLEYLSSVFDDSSLSSNSPLWAYIFHFKIIYTWIFHIYYIISYIYIYIYIDRERDRERDRQTEWETDRQRDILERERELEMDRQTDK